MDRTYDLYPEGRDLLGIVPNGPRWGKLTITDEVRAALPVPSQKCIVEIYDEAQRKQQGASRTLWIGQCDDMLRAVLDHLNVG